MVSSSEVDARVVARLPESATSLVMTERDDGSCAAVVVGPRLRAFYKAVAKMPSYTRFTFRPGAARRFLGVGAYELSERAVSLDELWGAKVTTGAVESALIERAARARNVEARASVVERAARALEANADEVAGVAAVAKSIGVSERQLRQLFRDDVGISPKRFARIARIRRAAANAGRLGWAALAAEHGFYDQAHLNAEFRDLLGATPRDFAAGRVPIGVETCSRG